MIIKNRRALAPAAGALLLWAAAAAPAQAPQVPAAVQPALTKISADVLRDHVKYLASDELEGRDTPSRGLDLAAEYIAAQFKKAGLEPGGDDGYFQTARWKFAERDPKGFALTILIDDGQTIEYGVDKVTLSAGGVPAAGLTITDASLVKLKYPAMDAAAEQVKGKVILTDIPDIAAVPPTERAQAFRAVRDFQGRMGRLGAVAILYTDKNADNAAGLGRGRLIDPDRPAQNPPGPNAVNAAAGQNAQAPTLAPMVRVHGPEAAVGAEQHPDGEAGVKVNLKVPALVERAVPLRNVVGVLRGSDPALKDTYVLVTAHYDHVGVNSGAAGADKIWNGANDNASGTSSLMEIASALASLPQKPKRSIVFIGSRYYGRKPVFPIEKTVANVNLEQLGRTDDLAGPQVASASMTGHGYSEVTDFLIAAGEATGVKITNREPETHSYFARSDNQALADQGVPAHTLLVAYNFPDYHGAGDHWDKLDYPNMTKIARMAALAVWNIAESVKEPAWSATNERAARYLKAWKDRRGK
jgi:hypothetical protein